MDFEKLARKYRKKPLVDFEIQTIQHVDYGFDDIVKLLPHRPPFLFIDHISTVDFEQLTVTGTRHIDINDPIFEGHFPGTPVYPGLLQVEMIGQLAIAFYSLLCAKAAASPNEMSPLGIRLLKLHHALFQHEVKPGDTVEVQGKMLEQNEYTITGMGQVRKGDLVCSVAIAELYIV